MSTKDELSDQLNQILGVSVEWNKMSREDLGALVKLFGDPMGIVQLGVRMMKEKTREDIMGRKLGDILSSSTLLNLRDRSRGGPLGLGILPQIFSSNMSKETAKETEPKSVKEEKKSEPEPAAEEHKDEQESQA